MYLAKVNNFEFHLGNSEIRRIAIWNRIMTNMMATAAISKKIIIILNTTIFVKIQAEWPSKYTSFNSTTNAICRIAVRQYILKNEPKILIALLVKSIFIN